MQSIILFHLDPQCSPRRRKTSLNKLGLFSTLCFYGPSPVNSKIFIKNATILNDIEKQKKTIEKKEKRLPTFQLMLLNGVPVTE